MQNLFSLRIQPTSRKSSRQVSNAPVYQSSVLLIKCNQIFAFGLWSILIFEYWTLSSMLLLTNQRSRQFIKRFWLNISNIQQLFRDIEETKLDFKFIQNTLHWIKNIDKFYLSIFKWLYISCYCKITLFTCLCFILYHFLVWLYI